MEAELVWHGFACYVFVHDLDPERVKKPRLEPEPTKEQVDKFDEGKTRVIAEKKKERKRAKKQAKQADVEMAAREDEYDSAANLDAK